MNIFLHWIISAIAIVVAAYLIPGANVSFVGSLVLAIVLGLINLTLRPLIFVLTLPINILTLGLFSFVINALLIMLAAAIVPGFSIAGFWTALLFSIVLSLINILFGKGAKA
ncbi:MAG: phage holin family protein [Minisyncoccia bacterium]